MASTLVLWLAVASSGTLVVVTRPPNAYVYIDGEFAGRSGPQDGRLVLGEIAPGPHELRVALPGRVDSVRRLEVSSEGETRVELALESSPRIGAGGRLLGGAALLVALAGVVVVWYLRRAP